MIKKMSKGYITRKRIRFANTSKRILSDDNIIHKRYDMTKYESICARSYHREEWYGREVKGGWPGVYTRVFLGYPVVDRFEEVIVIIKTKEGYLKSIYLGPAITNK